jgi:hypothetical protein
MWWLSFLDGGVVIIEAASLAHARLLAALNELGRVSHFVEGYSINSDLAALIPDDSIGRTLAPAQARELFKLLKYGPQKYIANPIQEQGIVPSRRRA